MLIIQYKLIKFHYEFLVNNIFIFNTLFVFNFFFGQAKEYVLSILHFPNPKHIS